MLTIEDHHAQLFDELSLDAATIQSKYAAFLSAIHDEQRALKARSAALWHDVMRHYKLDGNWRYEDGKLHPVTPAADPMQQGAALASLPANGQIAG